MPRRGTRPTLQHVADAAGVSRGTASVILNDRPGARFATATAARVRAAAAELGYRPNRLATALQKGTGDTFALVSADLGMDSFTTELLHGASKAATAAAHSLLVAQADGDPSHDDQVVQHLLDLRVRGIVYASVSHRPVLVPPVFAAHPGVLLNCFPAQESSPMPAVVPDDLDAGRRAGTMLVDTGRHRDVLLLGGVVRHGTPEDPHPGVAGRDREVGLLETLRAAGGEIRTHLPCPWTTQEAREHLGRHLAGGHRPHGIVCFNDRVALGAYDALREHGLRVGVDVGVVSFDGSGLADWLSPRLSSLRLPYAEMGAAAIEHLVTGRPGADADHHVQGVLRIPFGEAPHSSLRLT